MKKYRLKVVSLFSGCGGLDLGFIQQGFDVIWANDFLKEAVDTYRCNIGDHIVLGDITGISSKSIPDNFDVLLGGFPCQGFSVANKSRSMGDKRNFLYKEMLRVLSDKKPGYFVAENVKGLLSMQGGKVMDVIMDDFRNLNYNVDFRLLRSSEYGVPQHRERVFIIGNRMGQKNVFPVKTHGNNKGLLPFVSTKDVVGFLSNVRTRDKSFILNSVKIMNHVARTNIGDKFLGRKYEVNQHDICDYLRCWRLKSGWSVKRIDKCFGYMHTAGHWFRKDNNSGSIPNPSDWWKLKDLLCFDDKYDKQVTSLEFKPITFEQSLRISNWETPSDTITATGPEIHPNRDRRMSVRECALIQGFPMDFCFKGSLGKQYRQVGNAVPVLLANRIAECIKSNIYKKYEIKRNRNVGTEVFEQILPFS